MGSKEDNPFAELHDATILGLLVRRSGQSLELLCQTEPGQSLRVSFLDVRGWDLSPFRMQNVISSLARLSKQDALAEELDNQLVPYLEEDGVQCFGIHSSVGLDGFVVARDVVVTFDERSPE